MRIELTDEQKQVQRSIREFAAAELRPNAARWDRDGTFPPAGEDAARGIARTHPGARPDECEPPPGIGLPPASAGNMARTG